MIINQTPDTVLVDLDELRVDPRVQQPLVESRVKDILKRGFDIALFGIITVSVRENGDIINLDGQHRGEAGRRAGWGEKVQAHAYYGLTLEQEAYLFVYLNKKANPSAISKFQVRAVGGEEAPVGITDILKTSGWHVGKTGMSAKSRSTFSAVIKAENIYTGSGAFKSPHPGPWIFEQTIVTITETWGLNSSNVSNDLIGGMALFLIRFIDHVKTHDLITVLQKVSPAYVQAEARQAKSLFGGSTDSSVGFLIHREYNKNRRVNKLPAW